MSPPHLPPPYLLPYLRAAEVHGPGFGSLLWASAATQEARFDAFTRLVNFNGSSVLDVGCGRADFLDFLVGRGIRPADYVGIEAVGELAAAAEAKGAAGGVKATISRADFVREPVRLFVGADVVVFSGSLNTMADGAFYDTLRRAYEAAGSALIFNFLDSPLLAGKDYLAWRRPGDVTRFALGLTGDVRDLADYLPGDRTVAMGKG